MNDSMRGCGRDIRCGRYIDRLLREVLLDRPQLVDCGLAKFFRQPAP
jgi:hypothetical protein